MPTLLDRARGVVRLASLAVVSTLLLLAAPGAVLADCMAPPPIEEAARQAEIVFVGTVSAVQDQGRRATVTVDEVWRGPDLPVTTVVLGGVGEGFTSVDRTYEVGMKYIFFPLLEDGSLHDNLCTNTVQWLPEYEDLRPDEARDPLGEGDGAGDGFDVASLVPMGALVLVVAGLLLVAGLVARGREA